MSEAAPTSHGSTGELDLPAVVAKAAGLEERCRTAVASQDWDPELAAKRLATWAKACAQGDEPAFRRRLEWDGWTPEFLEPRLGGTPPAPPTLPSWAETLTAALEANAQVAAELELTGGLVEERLFPVGKQIPFFHLWCGFLRDGRSRLENRLEAARAGLDPVVRDELERRLLNDLVLWSGTALYPTFGMARRMWRQERGAESRDGYLGFARAMLRGGLAQFLEQHASLARRAAVLVDHWVQASTELGVRLARDAEELTSRFGGGAALGPVTGAATGLSDRHDQGRQVVALAFEAGHRLVYKPRPVEQEAAFQELLAWVGHRGGAVPSPLVVLPREGYGWVGWVEPVELESQPQGEEYFRRAGGLLCLAWLLGASDLHAGNVVASAGGPALVDCETLMQPLGPPGTGSSQATPGEPVDPFSSTHLLGCWERDALGRAYDFGGLTGGGGAAGEAQHPVWRHSNTDAMRLEHVVGQTPETPNRPLSKGQTKTPADFAEAFEKGYRATYRTLLRQRQDLLAGPLASWKGARVRLLLRPSQVYGTLLDRLRGHRYQREGFLGGVLIDALNRAFFPFSEKPSLWPLVPEERRALEELDVPVFTTEADARSLFTGSGEPLGVAFGASGWQATRSRVEALSESQLEEHSGWLRTHLDAPAQASHRAAGEDPRDELVSAAKALGSMLEQRANRSPADWMLPQECPLGVPLSLHLYDGASGVALFLAALARTTGRKEDRELAWQALAAIEERTRDSDKDWSEWPLGMCHGLGGMIYSLTVTSRLLGDEAPLAWAESLATRITAERLEADDRLEVASGAAGALFALVALRHHRPASAPVALLEAAARRLAGTATPWRGGVAWTTPVGPNAMGLAHGAAGIGAALSAALPSLESPDIVELARAAFAGERPQVDANRLGSELGLSWCHGLSGGGIARAIACRQESRPALLAAIGDACRAALESAPSVVDHLCCGNGGRIELLLQAARVLADSSLAEAAQGRAHLMLKRRKLTGGFALLADGSQGPYDPGLFRGLSGIGYQLLRTADPAVVPAILAFEVPT